MSSAATAGRGAAARVIAVIVGLVVALNLLAVALKGVTPSPGGPRSSSYGTVGDGVAAYAELLTKFGHPIERLRGSLTGHSLDPSSALILLDPDTVDPAEARAVAAFVELGGHLIAGGYTAVPWIAHVTPKAPTWVPRGAPRAEPLAPVPEVAGVTEVRAAGAGSWRSPGRWLPVLGDDARTTMVVSRFGGGRVSLLADTSVLHNRFLDQGDNAALGLALAGPARRPILFAEGVHGFGDATGVAAVPVRWRWALGGLVAAALVFMVARGRRLGPPEQETRELPPPRRAFADSVAALLARTRSPGAAAEPVRAEARRRLARRAGLPSDAGDDALRAAGTRLGLPDDELNVLLGQVDDERDVMAAGRALARVGNGSAQPSASRQLDRGARG